MYTKDLPELIYDNKSNTSYRRLALLGRGGFAQCYEIRDKRNNAAYAGKVLAKKLIVMKNLADGIKSEIRIHRNLNHPNIVKFYNAFEDRGHMFIVLELCKYRSMENLHNINKIISVEECGFFIHQILKGVKYLHDHQIIHRDLKLKNIFLSEQLNVKIGDFGLATRIEYNGERKKTICGTPNYMAPEMLSHKGYSYEVDIWAVGCIMYTLLHGDPPFKAKSVKQIYRKIRFCDYQINKDLEKSAVDLLSSMLQTNPKKRPTAGELLNCTFMENAILTPRSFFRLLLTMSDYQLVRFQKALQPYTLPINNQQDINSELLDWYEFSDDFNSLKTEELLIGIFFDQKTFISFSLPQKEINWRFNKLDHSSNMSLLRQILSAPLSTSEFRNVYFMFKRLLNAQDASESAKCNKMIIFSVSSSRNSICERTTQANNYNEGNAAAIEAIIKTLSLR